MSKRNLFTLLFICLGIAGVLLLFQTQLYRLKSRTDLAVQYSDTLLQLGLKALESKDVPVGALLIYKNRIIGSGYNTVRSDSNLSGHAEINAMNNAVKMMGLKAFTGLDRRELTMISTFEPCEMCRGAMNHYRVYHSVFLKEKGYSTWFRSTMRDLRYEWHKERSAGEELQDSLFLLHPEFPKK
jgi:tRNA(Arg) A34 adenosine deaminase TadA